MTKSERIVASALFLAAVMGLFLASSDASAEGQWCVWNFTCPYCDPELPSWQCEPCTIDNYNCSSFVSNDCDADCDWEKYYCEYDCPTQGPNPTVSCAQSCGRVWVSCVGSCIPSI